MGSHSHFSPYIYKRRPTEDEQKLLNGLFPEAIRKALKVYDCKAVFYHADIANQYAVIRMGTDDQKRYTAVLLQPERLPVLLEDPGHYGISFITDMRANAEYLCRKKIQEALDGRSRPNRTLEEKTRNLFWNILADQYPGLKTELGAAAGWLEYEFLRPLAGPGSPLRLLTDQNYVEMAHILVDLLHRRNIEQLTPAVVAELLDPLMSILPGSVGMTEEGFLTLKWGDYEI